MVDEEPVDPPTDAEGMESTTDAPPGEETTDSETETLYLELDPARTMMYRRARAAGGEQVDAILAEQLETTVMQLYDNRQQFQPAAADDAVEGGSDRDHGHDHAE